MNLNVNTEVRDGIAILKVSGEVDVYTAPKLKEQISQSLDSGVTRLVVDVGDVIYVDSSGLGVLIGALKRARDAGGDMVVAAPNARMARILTVTGLNTIFNVKESPESAVEQLRQSK